MVEYELTRRETDGAPRCMSVMDDESEDGGIIALQSLSNAQLIQILQHHDGNDDLAQMVEEELIRRKTQGAPQ